MIKRITELVQTACACTENIELETPIGEISLDSLSFIELIVSIEEEFEIQFEDEDLNIRDYATVGDLFDKVVGMYEKSKNKA